MSNTVNIVPTQFVNMKDNTSTYGVRIYDNYENMYSNYWDKEQIPVDDLKLLEFCLNSEISEHDIAAAMFEYMKTEKVGCMIASEWYEWEQIMHLFQE